MVSFRESLVVLLERPERLVVRFPSSSYPAKRPSLKLVLVAHDKRRIGVVDHVVGEVLVVVEDVLDHPAEERYVGSGPQGSVIDRLGRCLGESRINGNQFSAIVLGLLHPFHGDGMVCGSIAAHDKDNITVLEVDPVIGHCAAPERLCQSRNSGAVSYSGLVFDVHQPQGPHHGLQRPAFLVVQGRASDVGNGLNSVNHLAFVVLFDEIRVSRGLDSLGYLRESPIPGLFLPFVTVRGPVQDLLQAIGIVGRGLEQSRALGAQELLH